MQNNTQTKTTLIPKLRFKEFDDEWKQKRLGEISKIERGRFSPRPRNNPIYYNGKIPFVQTSDVVNSKGRILKYSQTLNEKGLSVSKKFKKGSILITIAANIGYAGVLEIDMACPDSLIGITCYNDIYNYFLNYQLEIHQPKMDYLAVAAAQKNINIDFLKPYKFIIPSLKEQQKIATFLTAVDTKIQQLNKKKELLAHYKKGVMQQLFSQQLRFKPDVIANDSEAISNSVNAQNSFPDWEEKRLGEVGKTFNGLTGKTKEDFGKGKPYIQYMQIFRSSKINPNEFGFVKINENDKQFKVQYGDVFFTTSSETPKEIGTASVLLNQVDEIYLNSFCFGFRPNSTEILAPEFSQFLFRSDTFRKKIIPLAQGSTRYNMSKIELMKLKIKIPSLKEQQKIANYLSAIDNKITTIQTQIDNTQAFKKGLLQQMFV